MDLSSFKTNIDLINFAHDCRDKIKKWVGIPVSIGIAPTRTLSKLANKVAKDDPRYGGVVILANKDITRHFLKSTSIDKIWGVGRRLTIRLKEIGISNAYDLSQLDPRLVGSNFNVILERTVRELRAAMHYNQQFYGTQKQIMVSRSFGRSITSKKILSEATSFHASRAAEKLRHESQKCRIITAFIRSNRFNNNIKQIYASRHIELAYPTDDSRIIIKSANQILNSVFMDGYQYSKAESC